MNPPPRPTSGRGAAIGMLTGWLICGLLIPDSWLLPGDGSWIIALIVATILGIAFGDQVERDLIERDMQDN